MLLMLYKYRKNSHISEIFSDLLEYTRENPPVSLIGNDYTDICYYLLELYSNPTSLNPKLFHPFNFQSYFSLGTSWLLHFSFYSLSLDSNDFGSLNQSSFENTFQDLSFISYSFSEELINNKKWELAIYVLSFCKGSDSLIKDIIFRNINPDCNLDLLIGYLKVPKE